VNYQQIDWLTTELPSTLSAEDSPAKTSALPEKEPDSQALKAASGGSSTVLSRRRGRSGSSRKTYQPFAVEDWTKFLGASLRSGTMRNGTVYPLPPLAPLTVGTESGLWPTPRAQDSKHGAATNLELTTNHAGTVGSLRVQVVKRTWPTPTSRDWKDGSAESCRNVPVNSLLGRAVHVGSQSSGALNPTWVEWLMGFPTGHTDLKHWATLSSRKSQKSSEG